MEIIQIIAILFGIFALSRVYLRFKKHESPLVEAFFWAVMWFVLILIAFFPGLTTILADFLGIQSGTGLVVYLSIIILFYIMFRMYAKIEDLEKQMTDLVRAVAMKGIKINTKKKKRKK
jgi:hypothetical protein